MRQAERLGRHPAEARPLLAFLGVVGVGQSKVRRREAVDIGLGLVPAHRSIDLDRIGQDIAALGAERRAAEAVGLGVAVRLVRRRNPVGVEARGIGAEGVGLIGDARRHPTAHGVEAASLGLGAQAVDLLRREGNHPADGVGSPQRRLRAAQHFDPRDIGQFEAGEVIGAVRLGRVVDRGAVDQDQGLAGRRAAHPHLGHAAESARARHRQTRHIGQDVGGEDRTALFDGLAVDDAGAGRVGDDGRDAGGGDDHLVQLGRVLGKGRRGEGRRNRGRRKKNGTLH